MLQENLFGLKTLEHPLFGWGRIDRGWPVNPNTGNTLIRMVDSLFVIYSSTRGYFGLSSLFSSILIGPWLVIRDYRHFRKTKYPFSIDSIVLALITVLFMMDCLINGMINPIYTLCSGALISYYIFIIHKIFFIHKTDRLYNNIFNKNTCKTCPFRKCYIIFNLQWYIVSF